MDSCIGIEIANSVRPNVSGYLLWDRPRGPDLDFCVTDSACTNISVRHVTWNLPFLHIAFHQEGTRMTALGNHYDFILETVCKVVNHPDKVIVPS